MEYVKFTGEETEKEFLQKCLKQWDNVANAEVPDLLKIMNIATVFSEMRHRIEEME